MLVIEKISVGLLETNCYVVYDDDTKTGAIIDPGGSPERIVSFLKEKDIRIETILLTHGHFDHIAALDKIKLHTGAPVYISAHEKILLLKPDQNMSSQFGRELSFKADHYLKDEEIITIGEIDLKTLYTPGHTKGSVCYYIEENKFLFAGDTLFFNSVGRTDLPTGNMEELYESIKEQLFILPDEVKVYPGHGNMTSIGYEKKSNMII